ncbi:hypothetical protein KO491_02990 [Roseovarius nubinhibens]|uniref:hypothetical protein n=1 Tax=Roseovarius nubinhibens TaxID=314263 RepID=UPI001C0893FE|nr:hypothetical protein [Roseovarius nubinhibens]MBU2998791.1 hypothetical protein [Roseovarius nubinhibens]
MKKFISVALMVFLGTGATAQQDASNEQVLACRAFAASFGGYDLDIVEGEIGSDGYARAAYLRPSDLTKWAYACKFEGDKLIWAADENGQLGRWRTEETIRYLIDENEVVIQQIWSDGSVSEDSYSR